jgi:nitrite reductase/ring-hydroxylating ferredoxin subunit
VTPFPEHKIAIIRSSRKIGAISMECTHLGCLLNVLDRGFFCPCHGSEFGPRGQVYSGPATESLPWHEVVNHGGGMGTWRKTNAPQMARSQRAARGGKLGHSVMAEKELSCTSSPSHDSGEDLATARYPGPRYRLPDLSLSACCHGLTLFLYYIPHHDVALTGSAHHDHAPVRN